MSNLEIASPPLVNLRSGSTKFWFPVVHKLSRSGRPLKTNLDLKISVKKLKKSGNIKITIKNPKSSLWRTSDNKKRISFSFTPVQLNRILTDKLKRAANYKSNLYKCKIFKRCNRKKKSKKSKSKPVVVSGTRIGKQLEELKNLKIDCEKKCRTKACRKKYKKQCKKKILTTENPLSRGNLRNSIFKMLKFEKIGNPLFRFDGEQF